MISFCERSFISQKTVVRSETLHFFRSILLYFPVIRSSSQKSQSSCISNLLSCKTTAEFSLTHTPRHLIENAHSLSTGMRRSPCLHDVIYSPISCYIAFCQLQQILLSIKSI
uniref:Ovule protein n=1 Tax=Heterorhabditis bacteriophora TaxID=37862 RepID=A0A1I7WGE5_HETBA